MGAKSPLWIILLGSIALEWKRDEGGRKMRKATSLSFNLVMNMYKDNYI